MLKFEDADFRPLTEFPLSWRWTDSRWNELPGDARLTIRPLTEDKAKELWRVAGHYCPSGYPSAGIFECQQWVDATLDYPNAFEKMRDWLLSQSSDREQHVILSWGKSTAAITTWGVFCDYWDDFCYPASDDVTIFPPSIEWLLFYDHSERFDFATKRVKSQSGLNS